MDISVTDSNGLDQDEEDDAEIEADADELVDFEASDADCEVDEDVDELTDTVELVDPELDEVKLGTSGSHWHPLVPAGHFPCTKA